MILVQEPLILYQHFEQQEKLFADMLHSLLTLIVAHATASPANIW